MNRLETPRLRVLVLTAGLLTALAYAPTAQAEVSTFGITPTAGAIGDGRLTAQVSQEGTLICLRWPNATFYEHLKYKTGFWSDTPSESAWTQPYFGAGESDGVFAGIRYSTGATAETRWLRDAKPTFRYASETSNRLVATYTFFDGLTVEEETFNVPDRPFLVRLYRLKAAPAGLSDFHIVAYANPALRKEHGVYAPIGDYEEDAEPRYGTFALPDREAVLTALPGLTPNRGPVEALEGAPAAEVAAFVDGQAEAWGEGIYMAQGASVSLSGFQVGTDAGVDPSGPEDAYRDAADGELSGNSAVANLETTALMFPLNTDTPVAWYAAFGTRSTEALAALAEAQTASPEELAEASDAWWADFLSTALLPTEARARAASHRALISLRTGMDPESGAIVASTSCQPPYNVDWPRDGAFFQFVLNMNGFTAAADRHARFYPNIQYTEEGQGLYPKDKVGRFPMNAFADYVPGGPIDWEIDNTGFALWTYRIHAGFLSQEDPAEARRFMEDIAESAQLAADLLTECKDESNNLQCPANEDDNPGYAQTLHGAITTWLGLRSAAEIFEALGRNGLAEKYRARVAELDAAIRENFDPSKGAGIHAQQLAWSYWPAGFWTEADGDTNQFASSGMIERFSTGKESLFDPKSRGSQYSQKSAISLQLPPLRDPSSLEAVRKVNEFYVTTMMRQDTLHMGEFTNFIDLDGDGTKEYINYVATPHIWAQSLVYLSLIAAEYPEKLQVPAIRTVPPAEDEGAGCACGTAGGPGGALPLLVAALGFLTRSRRRRHS